MVLGTQAPRDTVLKRYRVAAGIDQPLRDPSPYATPLPTRPLSLRDPSSPSPPLMYQHATSPPPSPPLMHQHATSSHGTVTRTDNTFESFL